jgi:8-oxo-dGTP diphosphatase
MPHIHDKIDFCSETYVVFNNKVLLRKHDKYNIWLSVGGHIELDEDPNVAAVREVKEEVGLDVVLYEEEGKQPEFKDGKNKSLIPPQFMVMHQVNDQHAHIVFIYFAKSNTNILQLSDTEITEECRWFTKEELAEDAYQVSKMVQTYAARALEHLTR